MTTRNRTGSMGYGSMAGKGMGFYARTNALRYCGGFGMGPRFGRRGGFGGVFPVDEISSKTEKELLLEQKEILRDRLEVIDKQLKSL